MKTCRLSIILLISIILLGCNATNVRYRVHHTLIDNPATTQPKKIILLPADITVSEISAGGVTEEVEEWTRQATRNVNQSISKFGNNKPDVQIISTPRFTKEEQDKIDQYLALYDQVAGHAFLHTSSPAHTWEHKVKHFDYTLGPGLEFLRDKTGADAALFVVGLDQISSSERKAAIVVAALFGVGLPPGISFLSTGMVDLHNGNILWFNHTVSIGNKDIRKPEDAEWMTNDLLKDYPGLDAYKKAFNEQNTNEQKPKVAQR